MKKKAKKKRKPKKREGPQCWGILQPPPWIVPWFMTDGKLANCVTAHIEDCEWYCERGEQVVELVARRVRR